MGLVTKIYRPSREIRNPERFTMLPGNYFSWGICFKSKSKFWESLSSQVLACGKDFLFRFMNLLELIDVWRWMNPLSRDYSFFST